MYPSKMGYIPSINRAGALGARDWDSVRHYSRMHGQLCPLYAHTASRSQHFVRTLEKVAHASCCATGGSITSPEVLAEVDRLDVSTAQATVPADKDMILGMIRNSIGIEEMNNQVRGRRGA
jgi:hypothetical protein